MTRQALSATQVFDGTTLKASATVLLNRDGRIEALQPHSLPLPKGTQVQHLGPGILAPGLVDLQVNGGAGEMVGQTTDVAQLARICATHARLGATGILPTLITNNPGVTRQVIEAGVLAAWRGVAGFAGLHLEGPHLDPARKGAHDESLIRPMDNEDLSLLCEAAQALPALMVTVAPCAVTLEQIARLARAGVIVSLGHSDCPAEEAHAAHRAGARCVTHLFNAMSGLQARMPGLSGAALSSGLRAGIIADGVHVAPECLHISLRMKALDDLFLVSDAMAVAGTDLEHFSLNRREIRRESGRLTLADGTLAGADVTLPQSLAHLVGLGVAPERALAMASRIPADIIGAADRGRIAPGARGDLVLLGPDMTLRGVWVAGELSWREDTKRSMRR
ncbi:MAG: N-acetylglucosamine-6-phosphate deacetylase [Rhodobacteraceae bacterium]|nr:MAG: N-acetylglucosamine-6-phosphate deacetylase [Paracoccaceae bacterium]